MRKIADTEFRIVVRKLDHLEALVKGLNSANKETEKLRKLPEHLKRADKAIKLTRGSIDAFNRAQKFSFMDNVLGKISDRFRNLAEKKEVFRAIGGSAGLAGNEFVKMGFALKDLEGRTGGFGKVLTTFGGSMKKAALGGKGAIGSLGAGFKAVVSGFSKGSLTIGASIAGIGTALGAILLPIAAIAAGVFTLKKIWELNIGGMQTKFFSLFGDMKTAWGQFNAAFAKALQKLSPLFNAVLSPIFVNLKILFTVFKGIFIAIGAIISPVIDVLADVGKQLEGVFGTSQKGDTLKKVLKGIAIVFEVLGKTIGFVLKVVLIPVSFVLKGVISLFLKLQKAIMAAFDTKIFKAFSATIKSVWNFIVSILNKIPDVLLPKSLEGLKTSSSPAARASSSTTNNRTTNNNQQITFNSSRPQTPDMAQAFASQFAKNITVT